MYSDGYKLMFNLDWIGVKLNIYIKYGVLRDADNFLFEGKL